MRAMMMIIPAPQRLNKCNVLIKHILTIPSRAFFLRNISHMCVAYACAIYHLEMFKFSTVHARLAQKHIFHSFVVVVARSLARSSVCKAIYWLFLLFQLQLDLFFAAVTPCRRSNAFRINSLMDH
jgi:hypothetical protein